MITGLDVANAAGVSKATVSAVLSGEAKRRRISQKTADRVLAAAKELNYVPNLLARSVRKGSTSIIGILLPLPRDNSYARIMDTLETGLYRRNYFAMFSFWKTVKEQEPALRSILLHMPDAIITVEPALLPENLSIPVVTLFNRDPRFDYVSIDRKAIWRESFDILMECGHRRIAVPNLFPVSAPPKNQELEDASRFVLSEMDARGISRQYAATLHKKNPDDIENYAESLAAWLLAFPPEKRPTAAIIDEDINAIHLMRVLIRKGFSLPRDLSILSSGNLQMGRVFLPSLTTFGEDPQDPIGKKLCRRILERLKHPDMPRREMFVRYKLYPGESVIPFSGNEWKGR